MYRKKQRNRSSGNNWKLPEHPSAGAGITKGRTIASNWVRRV